MTKNSTRAASSPMVPAEVIENRIYLIRGQKVMLDSDLARLYGATVGRLNEQVTRNIERFPADFMFRLTESEETILKSQNAISSGGHGGRRRARSRVFTEHGVAMLSSVLKSQRAIQINVAIVRAFIRLRRLLASNAELAKKLDKLEKHYDAQFKTVFSAIRQLMAEESSTERTRIGFTTDRHRP